MAKLTSGNLTLEIRFREFDAAGWVQYEILFLWKNKPIIDDALLKRDSEYWRARNYSAFKANQYERDDLIAKIEKALETNEPAYWQPLEPDVIIAIYPEMFFPFLETKLEILYESEGFRQQREQREKRKQEIGKLPDDPITLIVFVDVYNFEHSEAYTGEGPALIMCPNRSEMEAFCAELKQEYLYFQRKYKIEDSQNE
jgi:hypothetical protein